MCVKPVAHFGIKRATIASHGRARARSPEEVRRREEGKRGTVGREMENKKGGGWLLGGG